MSEERNKTCPHATCPAMCGECARPCGRERRTAEATPSACYCPDGAPEPMCGYCTGADDMAEIANMTDAEVNAELRAMGEDPDAVGDMGLVSAYLGKVARFRWPGGQQARELQRMLAEVRLQERRRRASAPDGPPIEWVPNGDAGDSTPMCKLCGREQDEPHTWQACAEYLASRIGLEFDQGWQAAEDTRAEREAAQRTPQGASTVCRCGHAEAEHEAERTCNVCQASCGRGSGSAPSSSAARDDQRACAFLTARGRSYDARDVRVLRQEFAEVRREAVEATVAREKGFV